MDALVSLIDQHSRAAHDVGRARHAVQCSKETQELIMRQEELASSEGKLLLFLDKLGASK